MTIIEHILPFHNISNGYAYSIVYYDFSRIVLTNKSGLPIRSHQFESLIIDSKIITGTSTAVPTIGVIACKEVWSVV